MRRILPAILALSLRCLAADTLLDESQGLLGVRLGWSRAQAEAKLGHPTTVERSSPATALSTGCRLYATWRLQAGTLDMCFDGASRVRFVALSARGHQTTTVLSSVHLGEDTLATVKERYGNGVEQNTCDVDEGALIGAVAFRGKAPGVQIIVSSTQGSDAVSADCSGRMVVNKVALKVIPQ
jgi:hypothetical protein